MNDNSNLTICDSVGTGVITSNKPIIDNTSTGTFTLSSGKLTGTEEYDSTTNSAGVKNTSTGNIIINGGTLDFTTNCVENYGTISVNAGNLISGANVSAIYNTGTASISGTNTQITATFFSIYNYTGTVTINTNGTLTGSIGNTGGTLNIYNGNITVGSDSWTIDNENSGNINMYGGYLSGGSIGIHVASGVVTITGGTISAVNYGIYNQGILTLGIDDGVVSTSTPNIYGASTGVVNVNTFRFYDGIISSLNTIYTTTPTTPTGYEVQSWYNSQKYVAILIKTPRIVSTITTGLTNVTLRGSVAVPVFESNFLSLSTSKKYMVEFDYKCVSGVNIFDIDLYPDSLPQIILYATPKTQHYKWVVSSTHSAMTSCKLRFFDDYQAADETDITITNIRMYEVTV